MTTTDARPLAGWLRDTAERVLATYIEAFLGLLLASWAGGLSLTLVESAAIAAAPAGLTLLKAAIASRFGTRGTAALLPDEDGNI